MKHEIKFNKISPYTDLALESIKINNIKTYSKSIKKIDNIHVTRINVDSKLSKLINKKIGIYTTIEFNDITDINNQENVIKVLTKELRKYIKVSKNDLILVVGLGNEQSTPDSLGPKCIDNLISTNHIYELNILEKDYYRIAKIKPSVLGTNGIETSDIITSLCKKIKPKLVIIIDSLATISIDRLNKTIQINDVGILPGSGIGNKRKEISSRLLKCNVIAIGVPTVVSEINIIYELLNQIDLNDNIKINDKLINLDKYNLIVTPTEIDYIIECLSKVIYTSLNNIFTNARL